MGQVWRATDQVLQRQVAVKLLHSDYANHPEALIRFRSEARHAAALTHACIAQVHDYGESGSDGSPYLVMELVDGPSLFTVLAAGPVTPSCALDVIGQVASGLAAAHRAGVVHRDIKPANILLGPEGQVKITDFGIARVAGSAPVTAPGLVIGTCQYVAPERIVGGPCSPASDLYSLGIVLYECLTGVPPFQGSPAEVTASHLYRPMPPLPPEVPPEVRDLAVRLTAKDPAQRLADAGDLAAIARQLRTALAAGRPSRRQARRADSGLGARTSPMAPMWLPAGAAAHGPAPARAMWEQHLRAALSAGRAALSAGAALLVSVAALLVSVARPARERRRARWAAVPAVLLLVVLSLAGGEIFARVHRGDQQGASAALSSRRGAAPGRVRPTASPVPSRAAAPSAAQPAVRLLTPAKAMAFGPAGTKDGDRPDIAGRALRAGPGWVSQWYATAAFGNLKKGTGLLVDMGAVVSITSVSAQVGRLPGAAIEIAAGDEPVLAALHTVKRVTEAGRRVVVQFPAVKARYLLIWYTKLPPDGTGTYQADIAGIRVQGYR